VEAAQEQAGIRPEPEHAKSLLAPFNQIFMTGGHYATVFTVSTEHIFDLKQFRSDAWAFPLAAVSGTRRKVGWAEKKQLRAANFRERVDIPAGGYGFD
jgi:hypothetical protein